MHNYYWAPQYVRKYYSLSPQIKWLGNLSPQDLVNFSIKVTLPIHLPYAKSLQPGIP